MQAADIFQTLSEQNKTLVAVTKTRSIEEIEKIYALGIRTMGENRVQELLEKYEILPQDIEWHLIGHLQKNKVKYIAPFIHLIHSVDSLSLVKKINSEAEKNNRIIDILLQFKVAEEESKFGIDLSRKKLFLDELKDKNYRHIRVRGIMGMASFTENEKQIHTEFQTLKSIFDSLKSEYFLNQTEFDTLSMGMSSDWQIAIEEGSTMLRIGSALFQ